MFLLWEVSVMPIPITCPQCQTAFEVSDDWAGKRGKCNTCGAIVQVPAARPAAPAPAQRAAAPARPPQPVAAAAAPQAARRQPTAPAPLSPAQLQQQVLAEFRGEIPPVETPLAYRLGIVLVSFVMVLLPLVYVGIIALVVWGIFLHLAHDTGMLGVARGRSGLLVLLAYLAPAIIGGILVVFMIKPLFARSGRDLGTRSLTRDAEPLLFAFVDRVCAAVGAPQPKRIDIDCQVNASASFRHGIWSLLLGNDLVLTIGLPLVAGLSMRQFAGVLAHEFGHFSQGAGMRLTYLIRSISHWFMRVVYERDSWDLWLSRSTDNLDLRIAWVLYLAKFFVWLTRWILWGLMMIGHTVAGFLLRQMEFDADRYEARLGGSDTYESTCRQLAVLNVASQGAHDDLGNFYRDGRLGDDLPRLILVNVKQIPDELRRNLNQLIDTSKTGLFDTHPSDRERIASARQEHAPGIFRCDRPASQLLLHFDEHCRSVTWDFYRAVFGPQFQAHDMHPLDDLLVRQEREQDAQQALKRYFAGGFNLLRRLRLPTVHLTAPANPKETVERIKEARNRMEWLKPQYEEHYSEYDEADTHVLEATGALALYRASLSIPPDLFHIPITSRDRARKSLDEAKAQLGRLGTQLEGFEDALGERLVGALRLLYVPQVAARIEEAAAWRAETEELLPLLQNLSRMLEKTAEARNLKATLSLLFSRLQGNESNQQLIEAIQERIASLSQLLFEIQQQIGTARYPFDHAKGPLSLLEYLLPALPPQDDVGALYDAADQFLDRLPSLYVRVAGQLTTFAERVEAVLGLPPLGQPKAAPGATQADAAT